MRILATLSIVVCLVAAGIVLRDALRRAWIEDLDSGLRSQALGLGRSWIQSGKVSCCEPVDEPAGVRHAHRGQTYYEIRSAQGRILARSPLLGKARFPLLAADSLERFAWHHDFYLHRMRYVALRTEAPGGDRFEVVFARDHGEIDARFELLDRTLAWMAVLLAIGSILFATLRAPDGRLRLPWREPPSLLARLLTGSVLVSGLILSLAGWGTYAVIERGWLAQMDQALENRALGLAALCSKAEGRWRFEGTHLEGDAFQDPKSLQYFQVRDEADREIGRSASLGHLSFPKVSLASQERRFDWFHPGYLHKTRYVAISVAKDGGRLTVYFGQDHRDMKSKLRHLRNILLGIWIASEVLLSALLAVLVHVALVPLRRIATRLESVDETRLEGFDAAGAPREVRPLVDALSAALSRLDKAFARERLLVADLAHELRTPMAGIRTTLEVGSTDDEPHAREAMAASLAILSRMQSLADSLLSLARLEGGQIPSATRSVDLVPSIVGTLDSWRQACDDRGVELRVSHPGTLVAMANPEWVELILRNLFENAIAHARDGTWISLRSGIRDGVAVVRVANDGSELDPTEAERVFDRFWRKDGSRSRSDHHAGLGLSLSRELARRMGGTLSCEVAPAGEFGVVLTLPAPG